MYNSIHAVQFDRDIKILKSKADCILNVNHNAKKAVFIHKAMIKMSVAMFDGPVTTVQTDNAFLIFRKRVDEVKTLMANIPPSPIKVHTNVPPTVLAKMVLLRLKALDIALKKNKQACFGHEDGLDINVDIATRQDFMNKLTEVVAKYGRWAFPKILQHRKLDEFLAKPELTDADFKSGWNIEV